MSTTPPLLPAPPGMAPLPERPGVGSCRPLPPGVRPLDDVGREVGDPSRSARRVTLAPPTAPLGTGRPRLARATLVDIAVGIAAAESLWRPHVGHDPLSRTAVRLIATERYEVWLLGWTPGQGVDLHDHGASDAAFVVVEGDLEEITLHAEGQRTARLTAGAVGTVAAGAVHDIVNRSVAEATSIHVYADPLRTMTYYDDDGRARFTELVEEVPALLTSARAGRALHPAVRR